MIRYKLTTQHNTTYNNFVWTPMQWQIAFGECNYPCTNGVFHYYDSPHIAVLLNAKHADIENPRLWKFETKRELGHDGLKGWCKQARITDNIEIPNITNEQKIEFAIRCAMIVYKEKQWTNWANDWLENTDRSFTSAAIYADPSAYRKTQSGITATPDIAAAVAAFAAISTSIDATTSDADADAAAAAATAANVAAAAVAAAAVANVATAATAAATALIITVTNAANNANADFRLKIASIVEKIFF